MKNQSELPAVFPYSYDEPFANGPKARADKNPFKECQKQIFKTTSFRSERGVQRMTLLGLYFKSLLASAKQGDASATREQNLLVRHLDLQNVLVRSRTKSARSVAVAKSITHEKELARIVGMFSYTAFIELRLELVSHYQKLHGSDPDFEIAPPHYLDREEVDEWFGKFRKIVRRKHRAAGDVGYGKPPVETRWTTSQSGNPSGGRKKQQDDGWQSFREGLFQLVTILKERRKTKLTSAAVICRRLFEAAIKGDPQARREVRRLLIELDRRGLMVPPAPRPRRRRSNKICHNAHTISRMQIVATLARLQIKQDMSKMFDRVYGPDPKFHETIEHERKAALSELKAPLGDGGAH